MVFFFNDTATTEIYTLSLHDALPIWAQAGEAVLRPRGGQVVAQRPLQLEELGRHDGADGVAAQVLRSEEHTSELQSRQYLVCRLLLEKQNYIQKHKYRQR